MSFSHFPLLFLLLIPLSLPLVNPQSIINYGRACNGATGGRTLLPGAARLAYGVDLADLELTPSRLTDERGFRQPLFALSCNTSRPWTHPDGGVSFNIPDQFASVQVLPSASGFPLTANLHRTVQEFKERRGIRVGATLPYGAFSGNLRLRHLQEALYRDNKSIAEAWTVYLTMRIDLKSADTFRLSEGFLRLLPSPSNVPSYETSPAAYDTLVATFGTHYFAYAIFGGKILLKASIEPSYVKANTQFDVERYLEGALREELKLVNWLPELPLPAVPGDFRRASTLEPVESYGGRRQFGPAGKGESGWAKEWTQTVAERPTILRAQLEPLEGLIANRQIRRQVGKAVSLRLARAYLGELKNLVALGGFKLTDLEKQCIGEAERYLVPQSLPKMEPLMRLLEAIFTRLEGLRK